MLFCPAHVQLLTMILLNEWLSCLAASALVGNSWVDRNADCNTPALPSSAQPCPAPLRESRHVGDHHQHPRKHRLVARPHRLHLHRQPTNANSDQLPVGSNEEAE